MIFAFSIFTTSDIMWMSFFLGGSVYCVHKLFTMNPQATKLGLRIVWHLIKRGP